MGMIAYDRPAILYEHIVFHRRMASAYEFEMLASKTKKEQKKLYLRANYHDRKAEQLMAEYDKLYPSHFADW